MATYAEIALKVTANVRDAVRGIETVDKALERTDKRLRAVSDRTRAGLSRVGDFGRGVLSGQSIGTSIEQMIPQAGLAGIAAAIVSLQQRYLDKYFDRKIAEAEGREALAASPAEAAAGLVATARQRADKQGSKPSLRTLREIFAGNEDPFALLGIGNNAEFYQQARNRFREQAEQDPYYAGAILAALPPSLEPIRDELVKILADVRARQTQAQRAAGFRQSLQPQRSSNATVVEQTTNVYSSFSGLGGESNVGREVRAVLDRRDRNNGQYVTPYNRRR